MPGKRARPVRRGPSEKDQHHWHLAGGLPYRPPGSEGGCTEKARTHTGYGTSPCSPPYPE
jgi:hypothetical protein